MFYGWRNEQKLWHHNVYLKIIFTLWRLGVADFVEIIKIAMMLIKQTFKESVKVKENRNKAQLCQVSLLYDICSKF